MFAGLLLGFAFLAKMLQAFLVVPGFAVAYLWAGPPRLGRRIWQTVLLAGAAIIVGAGWWVAAELIPAADRPYFGGSTNNNILQLAIGLQRPRPADRQRDRLDRRGRRRWRAGGSFGGATGIMRLFLAEFGGQISWLLPAALISLAAMLWVSRRAVRTDRTRAAALLWGGWLLVTGLVFSYMSGIIHPYYMVALAPASPPWSASARWRCGERRLGAGRADRGRAGIAVSAGWADELLSRSPSWFPWLRWVIVLAGVAAAGLVLAGRRLTRPGAVAPRRGWRWRRCRSGSRWSPGSPGRPRTPWTR